MISAAGFFPVGFGSRGVTLVRILRFVVGVFALLALVSGGLVKGPAAVAVDAAASDFGVRFDSDDSAPRGFDPNKAAAQRAKRLADQSGRSGSVVSSRPEDPGVTVRISEGEKFTPVPKRTNPRAAPVRRAFSETSAAVPPPPQPIPVSITPSAGRTYFGFTFEDGPTVDAYYAELYRAFDDRLMHVVEDDANEPGATWGGVSWMDDWGGSYYGLVDGLDYYVKIKVRLDGEWSPVTTSSSWEAVGTPGVPESLLVGTCLCDSSLGWNGPFWNLRGDPINMATGAFTESFTDIHLPAPGVEFDLTRTYDSEGYGSATLGRRWAFPYSPRIVVEQATGAAIYTAEGGQKARFNPTPSGEYATPTGTTSKLTKDGDGWTLTTRTYETLRFDAQGRLVSWVDASDEGLSFDYDDAGLTSVTDAAGRLIDIQIVGGRIGKVVLPDGRFVEYGYESGFLTTVRDPRGQVWTYEYGASRLTKIKDPKGRYIVQNSYDDYRVTQVDATGAESIWTWDPAEQRAEWTDSRGGIWTEYYAGGVLRKVIDPLGNITSYEYNDKLLQVAVTDPRGNATRMAYDARGRMAERTNPSGSSESWSYVGATNDVARHTNFQGGTTTFEYNAVHLPTKVTEVSKGETRSRTMRYNSRGLITGQTSWAGRETTYGYDGDGNKLTQTGADGLTTRWAYDAAGRVTAVTGPRGTATDDPDDYTTTYSYDDGNKLLAVTDPRGNTTTNSYDEVGDLVRIVDPSGDLTTYAYDAAGRKITRLRDGWERPESWSYQPGVDGQVTVYTDATGAVTTYRYDPAGRKITMVTPRGNLEGADPANYRWRYGYDGNGNQTSVTDPSGDVTRTEYDVLNQAVKVTDPSGAVTTITYNKLGYVNDVTDGEGNTTTTWYDGFWRPDRLFDARRNVTRQEWDADGLLTSLTTPLGNQTTWSYDGNARMVSMTGPRGNASGAEPAHYTWRYGYDEAGNRTSVTSPLGHTTESVYDSVGNLTARTDPNGHTTTWIYDDEQQLTSVTGADEAVTAYGYNQLGQMTSRTGPRGNTTTFGYDAVGRLIETVDPLGRRTSHDYGPEGNRTETVTARGHVEGGDPARWTVGYEYDPRGLLTARTSPDNGVASTYDYDADGRLTAYATQGQDPFTYTWDDADRMTSVTRSGSSITYGYDPDGHVTSRTYPGGTIVRSRYDQDGRQIHLRRGHSGQTDEVVAKFYYHPNAALATILYPNRSDGLRENRTYDRDGRLQMVENLDTAPNDGSAGTYLRSRFTYSRDPAGNITGITETRDQPDDGTLDRDFQQLAYDPADRLVEVCYDAPTPCAEGGADPAGAVSYGFDPAGNRTQLTTTGQVPAGVPATTAYTYDAANQLTESTTNAGVTSYSHDADGNLTRVQTPDGGATRYSFDVLNRLRGIDNPDGTSAGISYDALGRRLNTSHPGQNTRAWFWDPNYPDGLPRVAVKANSTDRRIYTYTNTGITIEILDGTVATTPTPLANPKTERGPPNTDPNQPQSEAGPFTTALNNSIRQTAGTAFSLPSRIQRGYFTHHDHHNSITGTSTTQGDPATSTTYTPYGNRRTTELDPGTYTPKLGYTGQHHDPTTNTIHLRARQYHPTTGRLTTTDPATPNPTTPYITPYTYANNNPHTYTDPTGRVSREEIVGGSGIVHDWVVAQAAYQLKLRYAGMENVHIYADVAGYDSYVLGNGGRPDIVVTRGGKGYIYEVKYGNPRQAQQGIDELRAYLGALRDSRPGYTWSAGGLGYSPSGRNVCPPTGDVVFYGGYDYLAERMSLEFGPSWSRAKKGLILYKRFKGDEQPDRGSQVRNMISWSDWLKILSVVQKVFRSVRTLGAAA